MAGLISMAKASQDAASFYVPQFEISVLGSPLPGGVLRDVVEITYKDKLEEIDSCEIVVNNWDSEHNCFKYIGSEQLTKEGKPVDSSKPNADLWTLFDPCTKQVELKFGYAPGPLTSMLVGNFVTYEPNFPASGPPVLSVRILNLMHKLRSEKKDDQYTKDKVNPVTNSGIAEYINGKKRLPIPIETDPEAKKAEKDLGYVIQKSQYDIDFLWQRARTEGYDLFITNEGKLSFKPSTTKDAPIYQLHWGQSLIDFKPTLTTGNQYKSVTARGFDRATQKVIEEKVELKDLGNKNKDLHYLLEQCDPREERVVEQPYFTKEEAKQRAKNVFTDQLKRMVKATGTTIGLPGLRAGRKVQIGGEPGTNQTLGSRLSGTYFITATTHTFNSSGYTTKFEARREEDQA